MQIRFSPEQNQIKVVKEEEEEEASESDASRRTETINKF